MPAGWPLRRRDSWVALSDPAADDLDELSTAFDLPHFAVQDMSEGYQRPKLEHHSESTILERTEVAVFEGDRDQSEPIYLQLREAARLARAMHPMLTIFDRLERGELVRRPRPCRRSSVTSVTTPAAYPRRS
jgi:Mg2+ and Co2+ transporter CorA